MEPKRELPKAGPETSREQEAGAHAFPSGFDLSGTITASATSPALSAVPCVVNGDTVSIPVSSGFSAAAFSGLTLSGAVNPAAIGDPGAWVVETANPAGVVIDRATGVAGADPIKGIFTITSPLAATDFGVGDTHAITWNTAGAINRVNIEYSTELDAGGPIATGSPLLVIATLPAGGPAPGGVIPGPGCRISCWPTVWTPRLTGISW
ncbi:MAG: hypothetical protein ACE5GG_03895 [Candidatus Omnitrophota bacterium]